jgi:Ca-activated chloride channel family protein
MSNHNGDRASQYQPEELTAYALGQLHPERLAAVQAALGTKMAQPAGEEVREIQSLAAAIQSARNAEPPPEPSAALRAAIEARLDELAAREPVKSDIELPAERRPWNRQWTAAVIAAGGLAGVLVLLLAPGIYFARLNRSAVATSTFDRIEQARSGTPSFEREAYREAGEVRRAAAEFHKGAGLRELPAALAPPSDTTVDDGEGIRTAPRASTVYESAPDEPSRVAAEVADPAVDERTVGAAQVKKQVKGGGGMAPAASAAGGAPGGYPAGVPGAGKNNGYSDFSGLGGYPGGASGGASGAGLSGGARPGTGAPGSSGPASGYAGGYAGASDSGRFGPPLASNPVPGTAGSPQYYRDYTVGEVPRLAPRDKRRLEADLEGRRSELRLADAGAGLNKSEYDGYHLDRGRHYAPSAEARGGEEYESIVDNPFLSPLSDPLSTFSIDVDTASYANVRRFLNSGSLPPPAAVRIEELVNYFTYSYPQPTGREPFSVSMEAAECPWNAGHLLLRIGLKGKEVHRSERPPSNLTFLLDVSGSMADANKLPLVKATLMMLVAELTENDRVSIVTYAGEAGLRLPPTRGHEKDKIMAAIDSLAAGGSTHGSAGIQLAYEQAGQYFLKDGTNRVILATDGDLNVGVTSDDALVELIKEKAAGGTFLTVLGFGTGNLKDGKLEKLADNGNGVYAYIDSAREGRKVLVEQMSGSLVTIAKDVKIQIEFNPAQIASYRLLGYENRVLAAADFHNDKKDAGEIGAGHTVTALYELVPVGAKAAAAAPQVGEPLKYQATGDRGQGTDGVGNALRGVPESARLTDAAASGELLTLKLRYKEPDGVESRMVEFPLQDRGGSFHAASRDLQFAAAVAGFGMILRGSEHRGSASLAAVAEIAAGALADDAGGYRTEFLDLVRRAQALGAK